MDITEEMLDAAARALASSHDCPAFAADDRGDFWAAERAEFRADAKIALAAAAPLIAAQALRDGADLVERQCPDPGEHAGDHCDYRHAAALLRRTGQIALAAETEVEALADMRTPKRWCAHGETGHTTECYRWPAS